MHPIESQRPQNHHRWRHLAAASVAAIVAACGGGDPAAPDDRAAAQGSSACGSRVNNTFDKLLECVTLDGVRGHQAALQAIASVNGGTRAGGTTGYDQSVSYVVGKLTAAGYDVTLNPFAFVYAALPTLQQVAPIAATYEAGAFTGSGFGNVTASVTAVDISLALPRDPVTSGCEAADFASFPAGNIALIQRGTCTFAVKALNAKAAGASAVIIFNQGTPLRAKASSKERWVGRRSWTFRWPAHRSPTAWRFRSRGRGPRSRRRRHRT
jgi:PA domain